MKKEFAEYYFFNTSKKMRKLFVKIETRLRKKNKSKIKTICENYETICEKNKR